jgi:hypothetical protein
MVVTVRENRYVAEHLVSSLYAQDRNWAPLHNLKRVHESKSLLILRCSKNGVIGNYDLPSNSNLPQTRLCRQFGFTLPDSRFIVHVASSVPYWRLFARKLRNNERAILLQRLRVRSVYR